MSSLMVDGEIYGPAFPKPGKKRKKVKRTSGPPEADIQRAVEQYLDTHTIPYIRLPDALMRGIFASSHIPTHQKAIISHYLKGLPDLMCIKKLDKYCSMLPLEIKKKGGKLSQGQKSWQKKLGTIVAYSVKEAIEAINDWRQDENSNRR